LSSAGAIIFVLNWWEDYWEKWPDSRDCCRFWSSGSHKFGYCVKCKK